MSEFIELDWYNLYCESWGDDLTSDSFVHPAKVRPALSREIYKHAIEMEWLKQDDTVIDPFGGIGGFALHAILNGVNFVGVELEQRFVDLGIENIEMWKRKYDTIPYLGIAVLIQGDSRKLVDVLSGYNGFDSAISSPPFSSSLASDDPDKRGGLFRDEKRSSDKNLTAEYGDSEGQLGTMNGDLSDFDCAVSSPPFEQSLVGDNRGSEQRIIRQIEEKYNRKYTLRSFPESDYGNTEGQLGTMASGDYDCSVSSPPYEQFLTRDGRGTGLKIHKQLEEKYNRKYTSRSFPEDDYGASDENIGHTSGNTFWSASRMIVEQIYLSLKPGSVSIWVTKSFIRDGEKVDFPHQWATLCQAVGFEPVEWIRSWLVETKNEGIVQKSLFGDDDDLDLSTRIERKSFFRTMYEKKQRASKHFDALDSGTQMNYLWQAYVRLLKENMANGDDSKPTDESMYTRAWYDAYADAGEPYIEIDTSIDYEVVIVMRKPK